MCGEMARVECMTLTLNQWRGRTESSLASGNGKQDDQRKLFLGLLMTGKWEKSPY
jgi:hypothetical protein